MCVGFWCLTHRDYSLVLCTNRDEYLSRPTAPAHWHSFECLQGSVTLNRREAASRPTSEREEFVLSGTDTLAGGTWFGINKLGEVALLTNINEPAASLPSSRGHLCSSFLLRSLDAQNATLPQRVDELTASDTRYSGFNLLLLAPKRLDPLTCSDTGRLPLQYDAAFLSNDGAGNPIRTVPSSGPFHACGGISNGVSSGVDPFTGFKTDSEWPKVVQGRDLFSDVLTKSENEDVLIEGLFEMMRTTTHSQLRTRQEFRENILINPVDSTHLGTGASLAQTHHKTSAMSQSGLESGTHDVSAKPASFRPPPNSPAPETLVSDKVQGEQPSVLQNYYATRLSSVLLVRKDGEALFIERDVWVTGQGGRPVLAEQGGKTHHERRFNFRIK